MKTVPHNSENITVRSLKKDIFEALCDTKEECEQLNAMRKKLGNDLSYLKECLRKRTKSLSISQGEVKLWYEDFKKEKDEKEKYKKELAFNKALVDKYSKQIDTLIRAMDATISY